MKTIFQCIFSLISICTVNAQILLVDNPADLPLGDTHSKVATESDRFGDDTYVYPADNFSLSETTKLISADFYGEKIIGSFDEITAFSIYIMNNSSSDTPDVDPNIEDALIHLERIEPGNGFEIIFENGTDEMDIRVDFTEANGGEDLILPPGDYWLVAAIYSPDAGAGDPTLSWQWRFSGNSSTLIPQQIGDSSPNWSNLNDQGINASSLAWSLTVDGELSVIDNNLNNAIIYSNPATNIVTIVLSNEQQLLGTTIFGLDGKKINIANDEKYILNLSGLMAGVYLLNIETNYGTINKKVIVR